MHCADELDPSKVLNVPAPHWVHTVEEPTAKVPAVHRVQ